MMFDRLRERVKVWAVFLCNGFLVLWMMQTLLTKYWLAVHVALLCVASWIGLSSRAARPWFSCCGFLCGLEALALLPPSARAKIWQMPPAGARSLGRTVLLSRPEHGGLLCARSG
jgi:hypothetical protein